MSTDTKPTNPKDIIGSKKLDMGLVPDTAIAGMAVAFTEGALKYGRYNWRIAGVRASVYHAALRRHMAKWWNGQDYDHQTMVAHLNNAQACLAILIDAAAYGKLTDDRPPVSNEGAFDYMDTYLECCAQETAHLRGLFKDHNPHQYTIFDTPPEETPND